MPPTPEPGEAPKELPNTRIPLPPGAVVDRYTILSKLGKGGFGIGLTTARDFARAMGGDLTIKANAPNGCVFTLTLPAVSNSTPAGRSARFVK
jgi:signal transduction histidine kinase